ncbi:MULTISPECIES: RNA polymerase sigma factor [Sphingobacterium]|uniref:RNA polymerase sigma factor n=1 Tax=Sphingobacterium TaxID=28453 RepID=UPI0028A9C5A4|nr:sigma-70 family RNA polymerase sigma factor [Sphingobacterium multivorum]
MKNQGDYSDYELVSELRNGDHGAFEQLYRRYAPRLSMKLISLLKDQELAGDVLQDLFIKLWEMRAQIEPDQSIRGYLYTIAGNMAKDKFRSSLTRQIFIQSEFSNEQNHDNVSQFIDQKEIRIAVEKALEKLPPRQREVYTLFKLEGLSYKEIQDRLGISKPAVNRLIHEAGKKMKEYLQPMAYIFLCQIMLDL